MEIFQPALRNRSTVESWSEPLGMPRRKIFGLGFSIAVTKMTNDE